jgi:energy-coupling factor transporter transmembrane protein EcfT
VEPSTSIEPIDPRTKLALVFSLAVLSLVVRGLLPLCGVFVLSVVLSLCLSVDPRRIARKWAAFGAIFLFVSLLQSLLRPQGPVLLSIGGATLLTAPGLRMGTLGLLRLLSILQGGLVLARIPARRLTLAMEGIGVPRELALLSALGAMFVPCLGEELRSARETLRMRGVDTGGGNPVRRIRTVVLLFKPVLGLTLMKARELSNLLEFRGFRARGRRTSLTVLRMRSLDYVLVGASAAVLCLGLVFFA